MCINNQDHTCCPAEYPVGCAGSNNCCPTKFPVCDAGGNCNAPDGTRMPAFLGHVANVTHA